MESLSSMFKIGDKVRMSGPSNYGSYQGDGKIGVVSRLWSKEVGWDKKDNDITVNVNESNRIYKPEFLVKITNGSGRPTKPKKIKYIAQYEIDGDPVKEFYSRPELMTWLKENQDSEVQWETIRIYPVDKVMKPHKNIKISLRSV